MWREAVATEAFQAAVAGATTYRQSILRMFGIPESEIAASLREIEADGLAIDRLEITTCLRRGEIELATRYEPADEDVYRAFEDRIRARHADTLFSGDGSTVDDQVANLLRGPPIRRIAVAESCTGGLLAARLTERPGASEYVAGGLVAYADEAKRELAGVPAELIAEHGAVSAEVARALADGAIAAFDADVGVGLTGVAGPGGGTPRKPVGYVCLCVVERDAGALTRSVNLPGNRADVRDRATTVAMHLLRRALSGELDAEGGAAERARA
jgi:nicotinamide-nucleotide amidase